jgi:hypothetical protein
VLAKPLNHNSPFAGLARAEEISGASHHEVLQQIRFDGLSMARTGCFLGWLFRSWHDLIAALLDGC